MTNPGLAAIIDVLGLPTDARVNTRVPKKMLAEQGAPTAADRRAVQEGIAEISWIGALKPNTIGIRHFTDEVRDYLEIAVIAAAFHPKTKLPRLVELIHRAIPYPVLLVAGSEDGVTLSVAHKRRAQNEAGKVVVEEIVGTCIFDPLQATAVEQAFLTNIAIAKQPSRDLFALYEGWRVRIEALAAARLTGAFAHSDEVRVTEHRRAALEAHEKLMREATMLRAKAAREKQMNRRVELNVEIRRLESAAQDELKNL